MTRGDRLRDEIARRGFAHAIVVGTSMLPTLRPDELVRLEAAAEPRRGQIIAFDRGGGLLVHRVLTTGPRHVVCRGDNRILDDGVTPRTAIVGRAVEVFGPDRHGGTPVRDDALAARSVDVRLALRRRSAQARQVRAEVALFRRQAGGRRSADGAHLVDLAGLDSVEGSAWASAASSAAGDEASEPVAPLAEPGPMSIPTAVYSAATLPERIALVRRMLRGRPPGAATAVRAVAARREHRLAYLGAVLRAGLSRLGVSVGRPGDTTWPSADGLAFADIHLFTADELRKELESAGARVLELRPVMEQRTRVWLAAIAART